MIEGIAAALLLIAAIGMAWLGFNFLETYGGFLPWIPLSLALILGTWALIEAASDARS